MRTMIIRRTQASPTAYVALIVVLLASAFPLWWSFIIGSKDSAAIVQDPYSFIPGGPLLQNTATVVTTVPFWRALGNSVIVSGSVALLVVVFSALAGFAFAKLRFRGRNGLLVFVIATMAGRRSSGSCRSSSS